MNPDELSRRSFVAQSTALLAATTAPLMSTVHADDSPVVYQATGTRVGEMTSTSAIIWVRKTASAGRNKDGVVIVKKFDDQKKRIPAPVLVPVEQLEGACPGTAGRVRVRYGLKPDLSDAITTRWEDVSERTDYIHPFRIENLKPNSQYHYATETAGPEGSPPHGQIQGRFRTAPTPETQTDLQFCVMTCQGYPDRGHPDGHPIYPAMLKADPHFAFLTGDLVYYDNDEPVAVNARLACYHWERMFSLPRLVDFTRQVGTYWLKDDHDTLRNDTWPGHNQGQLTFAEGQSIFLQQAPMDASKPSYRTFRWGRDLQIWLTDGRDFRSPNSMADGPKKTIWGDAQKQWFKRTVQESTATWKILVSPTPLVGPDRKGKNDNHANAAFQHEGDELRAWLKANVPQNFFVICGDRHWQYHSVHPVSGLNEFSVGAASNEHAGGSPGLDKAIHRFHRVKGGFLVVTVRPDKLGSRIQFELRDVDGNPVYSWSPPA